MPCHILCTENRYQMKLTPPLALAFLALTSLSTAQTGQATAQEAGDQAPPTAEEDKAQVLDLQEELNHILSRTQNAHQQVTRTFELMDSLPDGLKLRHLTTIQDLYNHIAIVVSERGGANDEEDK